MTARECLQMIGFMWAGMALFALWLGYMGVLGWAGGAVAGTPGLAVAAFISVPTGACGFMVAFDRLMRWIEP